MLHCPTEPNSETSSNNKRIKLTLRPGQNFSTVTFNPTWLHEATSRPPSSPPGPPDDDNTNTSSSFNLWLKPGRLPAPTGPTSALTTELSSPGEENYGGLKVTNKSIKEMFQHIIIFIIISLMLFSDRRSLLNCFIVTDVVDLWVLAPLWKSLNLNGNILKLNK